MKTFNKTLTVIFLFAFTAALSSCTPSETNLSETTLIVTSPAFEHNGMIPEKYACEGENINPAITIKNIPEGTKSLVLFVDDPDAPTGNWIHWVVYNIGLSGSIPEDSKPGEQGLNSWQRTNYGGPCPPSGTHRYFFKAFALDTTLHFDGVPSKRDIISGMDGHQLARGELIGLFIKR